MFPTLRIVGEDVLFAHWPIEPDTLRSVVPGPIAIDTFDGSGWLTIIAHEVTDATLDAVPVSALPAFGDGDLRTSVEFDGD
jgi:uncharacterized protein YqjF (DUF2071 family)